MQRYIRPHSSVFPFTISTRARRRFANISNQLCYQLNRQQKMEVANLDQIIIKFPTPASPIERDLVSPSCHFSK